jgi:hypothetical protein
MTKIESIGSSLQILLKSRGIIARCELLNRTYEIVRNANLDPSDMIEIQKLVGEKVAAGIFANMLGGAPIFFDIPKLDTYTLLNGRIFHFVHTEKYSKQDFDNAYRKFQASFSELETILQKNLADILVEFMKDAGYQLAEKPSHVFRFEAKGRAANCIICTSVNSIKIDDCPKDSDADCIIVVPSAESLEPFIKFFRTSGAALEEAKIQVWIVNLEQGTVDPFIGYTTDLDIYRQFRNPRLAEMVRSTWGSKVHDRSI